MYIYVCTYIHVHTYWLYILFQVPVPWLQIFLSPHVWAIIVSYFCSNFGFYVLLTTMPTYFSQALGFSLGKVLYIIYIVIVILYRLCILVSVVM